MKRALACLAVSLSCALPTTAKAQDDPGCGPEDALFFGCDIPEHNARIQICRNTANGGLTYSYIADGKVELRFGGGGASGAVKDVRGMNGWSYYTGLSGGGPFFAIFVAEAILLENADPATVRAPNPVVLQVYSSVQALEAAPENHIARRVCEPRSIHIDRAWFGPG